MTTFFSIKNRFYFILLNFLLYLLSFFRFRSYASVNIYKIGAYMILYQIPLINNFSLIRLSNTMHVC